MIDCSISDTSPCSEAPGEPPCSVLVVEDDAGVAAALELLLDSHGFAVAVASSADEALHRFSVQRPDLILLDLNLSEGARSGAEGLELLGRFLQLDPAAVVVVLTAHSGVVIAVEAMRSGAHHFVMKPWSNKQLITTLRTAAGVRTARAAVSAEWGVGTSPDLIGLSDSIRRNREDALRASRSASHVLIFGEAGSGKERIARLINHLSGGSSDDFILIEPAHLDDEQISTLLQSALRPPEGAVRRQRTVLITQVDLLKAGEQERLSRRLASLRDLRERDPTAGPRVVGTIESNRLRSQITAQLRPDLLAQIGGLEILTRPLRSRTEDVLPIARFFIDIYSERARLTAKELTDDCAQALQDHPWVGNVDSLRGMIERAVHLEKGPFLTPQSFGLDLQPEAPVGSDLNLEKAEKALLVKALSRHRYNVTLAARDLGLTRAALYRRMERHGL